MLLTEQQTGPQKLVIKWGLDWIETAQFNRINRIKRCRSKENENFTLEMLVALCHSLSHCSLFSTVSTIVCDTIGTKTLLLAQPE